MNGVINVYKSTGMTSFAVVAMVRKLTGISKVGHLGTLDPMAEGVLPVCVGYATRFADYLSSVDKEYVADIQFGISTDSYDTTGTILSENSSIIPTRENIEQIISSMVGDVELTVPAFSAKKIDGVRAYKLAREGKLEDAGTSVMHIKSIQLLHYDYPNAIIRVDCGKGTYIRSIIDKLGKDLGSGAAMSGLIRSKNGVFTSQSAYNEEQLKAMKEDGTLSSAVVSVDKLLDFPKAIVKQEVAKSVLNGKSPERSGYITLPIEEDGDNFFILDSDNNLLAMAERVEGSPTPLKLKMVFN